MRMVVVLPEPLAPRIAIRLYSSTFKDDKADTLVPRPETELLVELALEGRRRVKEQLKKMGSFEYYHTSFSYTLQETGEDTLRAAEMLGMAPRLLVKKIRTLGLMRSSRAT